MDELIEANETGQVGDIRHPQTRMISPPRQGTAGDVLESLSASGLALTA